MAPLQSEAAIPNRQPDVVLLLFQRSNISLPAELMPIEVDVVERAFQLARSGECRSLDDVKQNLRREGYFEIGEHFDCPLLRRQLRDAMAEFAS